MSTKIQRFLLCDKCGKSAFGLNKQYLDLRKAAKRSGWTFVGTKDYCPSCNGTNKKQNSKSPNP